MMTRLSIFFCILFVLQHINAQPVYPKREVRGAWVATVKNIDWPSSNSLSSGEQIEELLGILDALKEAGINTLFFQVRTECDALYESNYEPWSFWLTGEQGSAPEPFYDPLQFVISEAHARGMELHAWLNPYRAVREINEYAPDIGHVSESHPDWILRFDNYKMLNPGMPRVREHVLNVVTDIIVRYEVDGIHFDDYFYPYSPKVSDEDAETFKKFNRGISDIDDWRRDNVNLLMSEIYDVIEAVKPKIKFGISPFGIVQNHYADTDGFSSYDILYCDPLSWIENEYVDYINPQLYWEIGHEKADYLKLAPWWTSVKGNRHLYIGHYSSKMAAPNYKGIKGEIGMQIALNRKLENIDGSVFFSAKSITQNYSGLSDSMKYDWYKYAAFPPEMNWKDSVPPNPPGDVTAERSEDHIQITWEIPEVSEDGETAEYFVVYRFAPDEPVDIQNPANIVLITRGIQNIFTDDYEGNDKTNYRYLITSMDELHNESKNSNTISRFINGK